MLTTLDLLDRCLKSITESEVRINFHDVYGIAPFNKELDSIISKYQIHNNPFCDRVKKTSLGLTRCINAKNCAVCKAEETKSAYFGYCYMGLGEFVYPVFFKDKLVAVMFVGEFTKDYKTQLAKLESSAIEIKADKKEMKQLFENVTIPVPSESLDEKIQTFIKLFQLFLYESGYKFTDAVYENHIVESAMSFIGINYASELSLELISNHCHCNPTYLSRVFKESTGTNISEYINRVRIERAKTALQFTGKSVTDIGYEIGYSDTAYFSKVFKKLTGMSPKEYRKYFEDKNVN